MNRGKGAAKIIGVGLVVAVAAVLFANWLSGQGIYSPDVDVDQYGNITIDE